MVNYSRSYGLKEGDYPEQVVVDRHKAVGTYERNYVSAVLNGKNVSLILCVWKLGYIKSGHIYRSTKHKHWESKILCKQYQNSSYLYYLGINSYVGGYRKV